MTTDPGVGERRPSVAARLGRWSGRPHVRRWAPQVVVGLLGAALALASLGMTSNVQGEVGPGTVSVGAKAGLVGATGVALPPFGVVRADTHVAPVSLRVRVDAVDVEQLQGTLSQPRPQVLIERDVRRDLAPLLFRFAGRTALFAVVIGAVTGLVVARRHWTYAVAGGAGGLVGVGAVLGLAWFTFDVRAFSEATFTGALERAPAIMETVQRHVGDLDQIEGRVRVVSDQVAALYAASEAEPETGQTLILHVSDIHSNPLGMELTEQLATSFDVDAVLDTGDITSFGIPVESRIVDVIGGLDVPYYLVPGNHDSAAIRESVAASGDVTLLDGAVATVGQVRIFGVGDPTYTAENEIDTDEANETKLARAGAVADLTRRQQPDLLAVHDLRQAAEVEGGDVDTVVAGHTHERGEEVRDGTLLFTVGSTGATGLGTFTVETDQGYEAQVLRYAGRRLVAVDYVTLSGVSGSFEIDRRVVTEEDRRTSDEEEGDDRAEGALGVSRAGRAAPGRSGRTGAGS